MRQGAAPRGCELLSRAVNPLTPSGCAPAHPVPAQCLPWGNIMLDQITRAVEQALQTQPVAAKKNIILLSDGTGNSAARVWRTNVWRTFQALDLTGSDQIAIYDDGVGTSSFKPLALIGGAFGYGLKRNVLDLYAFL